MKVRENVLKVCLILPTVLSKLENHFQIMNWYVKYKLKMDLGENYRNINGCKTFAASIAQTLVDKQVKFQILSYKFFFNPWFFTKNRNLK